MLPLLFAAYCCLALSYILRPVKRPAAEQSEPPLPAAYTGNIIPLRGVRDTAVHDAFETTVSSRRGVFAQASMVVEGNRTTHHSRAGSY